MAIKDEDILLISHPQLTVWEKTYLPQIVKGLMITLKNIFRKKITIQYPEQRREDIVVADGGIRAKNYRGIHRLNRDEQGREVCVACFMCSTACPANCITIVGEAAPWDDREKRPATFEIDELKCIYCGMCEYACPVDAIELTPIYNMIGLSRDEMIYDKEKLLSVYDETKDSKPRKKPMITGYSCDVKDEAIAHRDAVESLEREL